MINSYAAFKKNPVAMDDTDTCSQRRVDAAGVPGEAARDASAGLGTRTRAQLRAHTRVVQQEAPGVVMTLCVSASLRARVCFLNFLNNGKDRD